MAESRPGARRLIKKYPNRRLYDTEQSRYITLEELAGLVKGGAKVKVVDAKEGKDLTRQVLTQVILEQQDRLDLLPVELLHLVIQVQDTIHAAPLQGFLKQAFEAWEGLSRGMGRGATAGASGAGRMAEAWAESMRSMAGVPGWGEYARRMQEGWGRPGREARPEPARPEPAEAEASAEPAGGDDLQARMDALLNRLRNPSG